MHSGKSFSLLAAALALGLTGCQPATTEPSSPSARAGGIPLPPPGTIHYEQAVAIRERKIRPKRLLQPGEIQIFWKLISWARPNGLRVFPQASLGEAFSSKDKRAHDAINCKRADFLVTDKNFLPVALVEYHGSGHYGIGDNDDTARHRDLVKEIAAKTAGIAYIVIEQGKEENTKEIMAKEMGLNVNETKFKEGNSS